MRASRLAPSVAVLGTTALVGLSLAGCSSDTHAAAQPAATTASATATPTPTGLAAKLLTPADLPAGWSTETSATNPAMSTPCPVLNPAVWNDPLPGRVETDLSAGLTGPFLVEQIAAGDAAQLQKAWGAFTAAIPKCTTFTHAGSSGSSTFTVTTADFPKYGLDSYGFGLSLKVTAGVSASGSIVVVRTNSAVVLVYVVGVTAVSKDEVEQIVTKAVAKSGR
jgi:hypothetical protein